MPVYRLGIDIGGTFTDFSLLEEGTGHMRVLKTASDSAEPEKAVFEGISKLFKEYDVKPDEIRYFIHGTTLAVNTVIQRAGAKTAFLITEGFRDVLNIGQTSATRRVQLFHRVTTTSRAAFPRLRNP